jgi:hypothetical protein
MDVQLYCSVSPPTSHGGIVELWSLERCLPRQVSAEQLVHVDPIFSAQCDARSDGKCYTRISSMEQSANHVRCCYT